MDRREFVKALGMIAVGCAARGVSWSAPRPRPELAITIDDFNWNKSIHLTPQQRNQSLLNVLKKHKLQAAIFVKANNVEGDEGKALLRDWDRAGHIIANHTYSHPYLHSARISAQFFNDDILKAHAILSEYRNFQKLFRFPYLKEGESVAKRDAVREFLKRNGYRNGHVTIDASDWAIDDRLSKRLESRPNAELKPYRDFYLEHMEERAGYYDDLAQKLLGRPIKHTVLMHFNLLNALFLDDLLAHFKERDWKLIDAKEAFQDPIFNAEPNIVPAGESLIWALAKESGRFETTLRYPAEDSKYEKARMDERGL